MSSDPAAMPSPFGRMLPMGSVLAVGCWTALLYLTAGNLDQVGPGLLALEIGALSVPLWLASFYFITVQKLRTARDFKSAGWIHFLVSGRILRYALSVIFAVALTYYVALLAYRWELADWLCFCLAFPVYHAIYPMARKIVAGELRGYLVTSRAIAITGWITTGSMALAYFAWQLFHPSNLEVESVNAAIEAAKLPYGMVAGSALVYESLEFLAIYEGTADYMVNTWARESLFSTALWIVVSALFIFRCAAMLLAATTIPADEHRRSFAELVADDVSPHVAPNRVAMTSALVVIIFVFMYVPLVAWLESWCDASDNLRIAREKSQQILERIDDEYFKPGTVALIQQAQIDHLSQIQVDHIAAEALLNAATAKAIKNVDRFLDWYYSLSGEYTQIGIALAPGVSLEDFLQDRLVNDLARGNPYQGFFEFFAQSERNQDALRDQLEKKIQAIKASQRVRLTKPPAATTKSYVFAELISVPAYGTLSRAGALIGGGGVSGAVSAVVAKKIASKVAGKSAFKVAAKGLAKIAASKTASAGGGAAAGAAAGAAVGSVFPGLGNIAGALVGGLVGIVGGLTIDKGLIKAEELVARPAFRETIVDGVEEQRRKFLAILKKADTTGDAQE